MREWFRLELRAAIAATLRAMAVAAERAAVHEPSAPYAQWAVVYRGAAAELDADRMARRP